MLISLFSTKRLLYALAVLVALVGLGLLVSGKQSAYAQVPDQRIPDLTGIYDFNFPNVCHFENMVDTTVPPVPLCGTPGDASTEIEITRQSGRVFAGGHPGAPDKLTGYLAHDGTVSIHYFSTAPHEWEHVFVTATLGIEKGKYVMRGYAHGFSELPMPPPSPEHPVIRPYMHTMEVYVVKR